jgi:hypothetical protein
MRRALGLLVLVLVVAGCGGPAGGGGAGGGELPPLSAAWFGSGYDPGNLGVTGRAADFKVGTPIVAVGTLLGARNPDEVSITISTGGSVRKTLPPTAGSGQTYVVDPTPLGLGPAGYLISFVDKAGKQLASGSFNVKP